MSISYESDTTDERVDEHTLDVLRRLIRELPDRDRAIIGAYYQHSKSAKIENRARLARESLKSHGALRVKVYRLRVLLAKRLREILDAEERDTRSAAGSGGRR